MTFVQSLYVVTGIDLEKISADDDTDFAGVTAGKEDLNNPEFDGNVPDAGYP